MTGSSATERRAYHHGKLRQALALRATAYGLARMCVDGQLPQWKVDSKAQRAHVLSLMDATVEAMTVASP